MLFLPTHGLRRDAVSTASNRLICRNDAFAPCLLLASMSPLQDTLARVMEHDAARGVEATRYIPILSVLAGLAHRSNGDRGTINRIDDLHLDPRKTRTTNTRG